MDYPFWDVDIGYGLLMGFIAVFHVFISHFAIGGGLYLVVVEISARKRADNDCLEYLKRLSRFFVLTTVVMGALSGVAIWFVIGLINPAATGFLIRHFVWVWAIEWTFFIVEIAAALFYYYGWDHLSKRSHLIIGWIYFGAAWLSLFAINGIITFMLTPGEWLVSGELWDSFFNPTFWQSLVLRSGICIMMAGLFALLVASRMEESAFRKTIIRTNALWGILGIAIVSPALYWYYQSIPLEIREITTVAMPFVTGYFLTSYWLAAAISFLLIFPALIIPRFYNVVIASVVMLLGLIWFGQFEWMRESIRKPYAIHGYMYANAVELADVEEYQSVGMLSHMKFRSGDDGADLFRHACRSCHTLDGYRPLKNIFDGTDQEFISSLVKGVSVIKGNMPPFSGTEEEAKMIAAHIFKQVDHRPLTEIYGITEKLKLGEKVYDIRCGVCHQLGGYNDKIESIEGLTREDFKEIIDNASEYADEMPVFTASNIEREALIKYLMTLSNQNEVKER